MSQLIRLAAKQISGPLIPNGPRAGFDTGDPQTSVLPLDEVTKDQAGVWEWTPGGWPAVNRPTTIIAVFYAISSWGLIEGTAVRAPSQSPLAIPTTSRSTPRVRSLELSAAT